MERIKRIKNFGLNTPINEKGNKVSIAVWSNHKHIFTLCPYCDNIHKHNHKLESQTPLCEDLRRFSPPYDIVVFQMFRYDSGNKHFLHSIFDRIKSTTSVTKAKKYIYGLYQRTPDLFIEDTKKFQRRLKLAYEDLNE